MRHLVALLVLTAACATPEPPVEAPVEELTHAEIFQRVGAAARVIKHSPENHEAILRDHGLTRAQFEDALYMIARDPALSAAYAEALK